MSVHTLEELEIENLKTTIEDMDHDRTILEERIKELEYALESAHVVCSSKIETIQGLESDLEIATETNSRLREKFEAERDKLEHIRGLLSLPYSSAYDIIGDIKAILGDKPNE